MNRRRVVSQSYMIGLQNYCFWALSLWLCCLLPACAVYAQNHPHPAFRHYTTDDGLPSPEIYFTLQDREGFIWICTDNGVARFDGYTFRKFSAKDGLLENVIFQLQLDTLGRVWMLTMSCNLYYFEGDSIKPYWNNEVLEPYRKLIYLPGGFIVEGAGDTVHIGTQGAGVITIARDGAVKTYQRNAPFYYFVFEKGDFYSGSNYRQPDRQISREYQDSFTVLKRCPPLYFAGEGWSGSCMNLRLSSPSSRYNMGQVMHLKPGLYLFFHFLDAWLIERGVSGMHREFPHTVIWASTLRDGRLVLGLHHHEGLRIYPKPDDFFSDRYTVWLQGESVSHVSEDREGGLWVATHDNGLFYAPADAMLIFDRETGLTDDRVTAVALKNENELYVGLGNGDVYHLQTGITAWLPLPAIPQTAFIRDLFYDMHSGDLWAGRQNLFRFKNGKWAEPPWAILSRNSASNRLTSSPDGRRLWGTYSNGFMGYQLPAGSMLSHHYGVNQRTLVVREDYNGSVWVGRPNGLYEWMGDTLLPRRELHPAFSHRIEDIALSADSSLLIGTKGGGVVFWKGNRFEQITSDEGLTSDMVESVYVDGRGVAWVGTLNGLNRITGDWGRRRVEQITTAHGLPSNEINRVASMGDAIWIATNKGLTRWSEKRGSAAPKPIFEAIHMGSRPLDPEVHHRLAFSNDQLTIRYRAINFRMNGRINYRYRMDGGDWNITPNLSLVFPSVGPGAREFEVQACNEDGIWSEGAIFRFTILPPWWQSWWFRVLAAGMIAGGGYGVYRYRLRQLQRENELKEQMSALKHSALQAQIYPHFIFNCLNSIQQFILQNEKEEAILYLGKFAKLVRGMLHASAAGKISLEDEMELLHHYLSLEQLRFDHQFAFDIRLAEGVDAFELEIPPLLVQPYVENAVLHGIVGRKTGGGMISVQFATQADYLEVTIVDNGKGIMSAEATSGAKKHKSVGMSITRERLELISGEEAGNIVQTRPILDGEGAVVGTEVKIRIGL